MLMLTKLDDSKILVSLASIKYMEAVPDTLIFFLNGDSLMVKESLKEICHFLEKNARDLTQTPAECA